MSIKFCLTSQQPEIVLSRADEIITNEIRAVPGLLKKFPRAKVIYVMPWSASEGAVSGIWDNLMLSNVEHPERLIVCLRDLEHVNKCKELKLKFYLGYKITTFYEARYLTKLGVEYLKIGAPLTHHMKDMQRFRLPLRVVPNIAVDEIAGRDFAYAGSWIRPEDFPFYNRYNITYEFEGVQTVQEKTLFELYKDKLSWSGPIKDIILNMPYDAVNRLITPDIVKNRANCGQRCMRGTGCQLCLTTLKLASPDFLSRVTKNAVENENGVTI